MQNPYSGKSGFMLLFILAITCFTKAQTNEKFEYHVHNFYDKSLPYRLFVPEEYSDTSLYPLILTLHGAGEKGTDNEKHIATHPHATVWAEPDNQINHPCFVVAPQCPTDSWWSNESIILNDLLDSITNRYSIDTNRLYITGLSMGGFGTFTMLKEYPNKFAAAVPMSGGISFEEVLNMENIPPIWNFHGDADGLVSVHWSRTIFAALDSIGKKAIYPENLSEEILNFYLNHGVRYLYSEYKNGGHEVWAQSYENPRLIDWVFRQKLNKKEYQYKYAFDIYHGKYFNIPRQDTIKIYSNINNPEQNEIAAFATIKNETETYENTISLFDDGKAIDKIPNDGLFSNFLIVPTLEDYFSITVNTIDKDSNDHDLSIPISSMFTTVGPLNLAGYEIIKLNSAANAYQIELKLVLKNNSKTKRIENTTVEIETFYPDNIKISGKNPVFTFGDIESGQSAFSENNLEFIFFKDTITLFALNIKTNNQYFWKDTLVISNILTSVSKEIGLIPLEFNLEQNYPNPFNPTTAINYTVPYPDIVTIKVFNILGNEISTLVNTYKSNGRHSVTFNASGLASGVYFYKLQIGERTSVKKMLLLQ